MSTFVPLMISMLMLITVIIVILFIYYFRKERFLQINNKRMTKLLNSMPDMAIMLDGNLVVVEVINPQKEVLFTIEPEQLVGLHIDKIADLLINQEVFRCINKHVLCTLQTRKVQDFDYSVLYNGDTYYVKGRTIPFERDKVICFLRDITKESVSALEKERLEALVRTIYYNLPVPLFVKDVSNDLRYLHFNNKASQFYAYEETGLIGKNAFEIGDPLAEQFLIEDMEVMKSDVPISYERIIYDEHQKPVKWGIVTKTHITNADGSKYIIGVVEDTTKNRLQYEEMKAHIFKSNFANKSYNIVPWDFDCVTKLISSPDFDSVAHHGISKTQYFSVLHPDDRLDVESKLDRVANGELLSTSVQARIIQPDGSYRWINIYGVAFEHDAQGKVTKVTGLRSDITEWKELTNELIALREQAEESSRLKTAFLANVSHEIRTPLNAIVGFSTILMQAKEDEEKSLYYKIIQTNNELLLQLINDIIDLSRIESERFDISYSVFDLAEQLHTLRQTFSLKVPSEVELICEQPFTSCILNTEKNRLMQVLSNFLSNACKFTSQGSITLGYTMANNGIDFYVTDTGIGISKENCEVIFERFNKIDTFIQGAGLGLTICRIIAKRLNGSITVESEIGKGSTFRFFLPCQPIMTR